MYGNSLILHYILRNIFFLQKFSTVFYNDHRFFFLYINHDAAIVNAAR